MPSTAASKELRRFLKEHGPAIGDHVLALVREAVALLEPHSASDQHAVAIAEVVAEALVATCRVPHDVALDLAVHMTRGADAFERVRRCRPARPSVDAIERHGRELLKVSVTFTRLGGSTWQRRIETWAGLGGTRLRTTESELSYDDLPDEVRAAHARERRDAVTFDLHLQRT